jgi:membrane-bound metal-dependent hydrolase YbcI (DUF457 family)
MVEPLLHFVVPFVSLRAVGVDLRRAAFASFVALTPDLDVLFQVHRSQTHSLVIVGVVAVVLLALTWNRKTLRFLVSLGTFGVLTHIVLDLFQDSTPVLWPLLTQSFWISATLDFHRANTMLVAGSVQLITNHAPIEPFVSLDAPIVTSAGLGVSIILLTPFVVQAIRGRFMRQRTAVA